MQGESRSPAYAFSIKSLYNSIFPTPKQCGMDFASWKVRVRGKLKTRNHYDTNRIRTSRNRKLIFTLYKKELLDFFITPLILISLDDLLNTYTIS